MRNEGNCKPKTEIFFCVFLKLTEQAMPIVGTEDQEENTGIDYAEGAARMKVNF